MFIFDVANLDEIDSHGIDIDVMWDKVTDIKILRKAYSRVVPKSGMYYFVCVMIMITFVKEHGKISFCMEISCCSLLTLSIHIVAL